MSIKYIYNYILLLLLLFYNNFIIIRIKINIQVEKTYNNIYNKNINSQHLYIIYNNITL